MSKARRIRDQCQGLNPQRLRLRLPQLLAPLFSFQAVISDSTADSTGYNLTEISYNLQEISYTTRAFSEPSQSLLRASLEPIQSLLFSVYIALVSCLLDSLSNSTIVLSTTYTLIVPFQYSPLHIKFDQKSVIARRHQAPTSVRISQSARISQSVSQTLISQSVISQSGSDQL